MHAATTAYHWHGIMEEEEQQHGETLVSPTGFRRWLEAGNDDTPPTDARIVTSGQRRLPAHSTVLASASPVLESMLHRPRKGGSNREMEIPVLGVPCDAVHAFLRLLYSARCVTLAEEEIVGEHGMHLMVLSHAYGVGWLKRACERVLSSRLTAEGVVDVLVLAQQCDAPRLHLRCMQLLAEDFAAVEQTEAWRFLRDHDPWLELDILQFLEDAHLRRRRLGRRKAERRLYMELHETIECLHHIFKDGYAAMGHSGREEKRARCPNPVTCRGLRQLVRHLAACDSEKRRWCRRCKCLWQLLRLHASTCTELDDASCEVPLCMQFKRRVQRREGEEADGDDKWGMLVKKVVSARVVSHLVKKHKQPVLYPGDSN
nr:PREDICTED: BTB/POZ and TAZ domain-containing protein 1-like [Musa acuminata subsp. malaccensis]XP_018682977.1 PREDICTED: BTB/POZ and TAZ domain-containing protein 1-like [Musa acuminata subsp. malaccensis]XP_018682978.1 PREDICTED: BTB/POZ and TAZ domain-containing protein 1-like [Musa acuminata subsp. malaccensis]